MAKKKTAADAQEPTFEEALGQLEEIVHQLESGDVGLAEALVRYEQGVAHLKRCYELLERAEQKIELLSGVDADGNPITTPLGETGDASLTDKAARRSRRRSASKEAPPAAEDEMDDTHRLF